jgi:hypothetical protein
MKGKIKETINSRLFSIMDASIFKGWVKNITRGCKKMGFQMQNL